jgi:hypothetical protein
MMMHRDVRIGIFICCLGLASVTGWQRGVEAGTTTVVVDSHEGPWSYVNGGLNTSFQYGIGDYSAPVVIGAANGFDFSSGGTFTIQYVSGLTNHDPGPPLYDASGDHSYIANNNPGSSGRYFPSRYFSSADYPAYLNALVGTFADSTGKIVGTPFLIGDFRSVVVPLGATRLQLGINDDIFGDNSGSLTVSILGPSAVPEPSSLALCGPVLVAGIVYARARRSRSANT